MANYFDFGSLVETVESIFLSQVINIDNFVSFWNFIFTGSQTGAIAGNTTNLQRLLRAFMFQHLERLCAHSSWVFLHRDIIVWAFDLRGPAGSVNFPSKTLALTRWFAHNEPERTKRKLSCVTDAHRGPETVSPSKRRLLQVDGNAENHTFSYEPIHTLDSSSQSDKSMNDPSAMDTS